MELYAGGAKGFGAFREFRRECRHFNLGWRSLVGGFMTWALVRGLAIWSELFLIEFGFSFEGCFHCFPIAVWVLSCESELALSLLLLMI